MNTELNEALARLDAEIRTTEVRLADLRLKRAGAEAFLEYMGSQTNPPGGSVFMPAFPARDGEGSDGPTASPSDAAMEVFRRHPGEVLRIDDVAEAVRASGVGLDRQQVRNGIHYATRKGWIEKAGRRGMWILRPENASAPAGTGAEVTEESAGDSSREMGGTDNGSALLRGGDECASEPQALHDHAGVRASIGGSDLA